MAYMTELQRQCQHEGCPRFADRAVIVEGQQDGIYCLAHARQRLHELNLETNGPGD